MARLPQPGGDDGTWGVILNDFLAVVHDEDGTLLANTVNTAAIQDDAVDVAKIATSNSPSTNQALVYNGTAMQWANMEPFIASGTTSQYLRGDKTWQTLDKTAVGLGNVDNTSDANKPISTATQTALDGKATTNHNHAGSAITSGTIDAARLPVATATTNGVVELATTAETVTGTDTTRAVTPAGVAAAVNAVANPIIFVDSLGDIPPGTPVDTLVVVRAV